MRARRRRLILGILAGAVPLLAAAMVFFARQRGRDAVPSAPAPLPQQTAAPVAPVHKSFIGSARCGECHPHELERWRTDWHARALTPATRPEVAGNFHDARFHGASSAAEMHTRADAFFMRTRGGDGHDGDFKVDWVIGGKRMQDLVTVFPDGRWQVLPVYWHVTGHGSWVDYTEQKQGALSPDHPFFWTNIRRTANRECLDCHASGLNVGYDRSENKWATTFADAGVACESCHGPGSVHAETQSPRDIVQPVKAPAEVGLAICAQCHAPRNPLFSLMDATHRFQPGDHYEDRYQPLTAVIDPKDRSNDFFADGRPSASSFEYTALLQSACFRRGKATCLTCHTAPHDKDRAPAELRGNGASAPGERACATCHAGIFSARVEHTHHRSEKASACKACHMPPVVTGVLDHFADHALDVPVPENTARHGVPNACGTCHPNKSPQATLADLNRWWPGSAARRARRIRLADALDEKTAAQSRGALEQVAADAEEAPVLRGEALQLLAIRFPSAVTAPALAALASEDALLRSRACEAIAFARARGAGDGAVAHTHDPSAWVRQACAVALTTWDDPRAPAALEALARDAETAALVEPHWALGMEAARHGELPRAAEELDAAIALRPYFPSALLALAEVYAREGSRDLAEHTLEELLQLEPFNAPARARLARLRGK